jgi:hypothetical protein
MPAESVPRVRQHSPDEGTTRGHHTTPTLNHEPPGSKHRERMGARTVRAAIPS